ncbi:MAG: histidinol-phosphate transaminase [Clostridia bacterium]|nr:histidinol-phosphate transaminase [Clostridia bacterium]
MSRYLIDTYRSLEVYTPGEQPRDMQYVKLNTNESPYPPSPAVIAAASGEAGRLQLYSDPTCAALRDVIAGLYGVERENVYASNGSDDILNFAFMAFAGRGGRAYFPDITYGFYKVFGDLHGVDYTEIPLEDDFTVDPAKYHGKDGLIVIANPNAPTGLALSVDAIEGILKTNPDHVVVVDEAYVDFGADSCVKLVSKYPNLLVCQTFSKSRSMAGARLGFAIADAGLIADLDRIRYSTNPYNVNRMTMAAGAAAIGDNDYYMQNCRKIEATREAAAERLRALGFTVIPSKANFLFAKSDRVDGETLYLELKKRGVLVRHFTAERIRDYDRITVGTPEQMDILIQKISEILGD